MRVLVTGGAGYIGSHMTRLLCDRGHDVVVVDDLRRGNRPAVDSRATFFPLNVADETKLTAVLADHRVECVMHFAALAYVAESVEKPLDYYENNVTGALALLRAVNNANVGKLVFSSSCATYGVPEKLPIVEDMPQRPINPYGWSKLFMEQALRDVQAKRNDFGFAALRYFNVCGSAGDGKLGEDHRPETHVIPRFLFAALGRLEKEGPLKIFGGDYDTPDGTCVRDYIHVEDVCSAHLLALENLKPGMQAFYNLAVGRGYSNKEVLAACERVSGRKIPVVMDARRPGDPPTLYASAAKIQRDWGWKPKYTELDHMIETAYKWFVANPDGYPR